jgi:hypothetical protein
MGQAQTKKSIRMNSDHAIEPLHKNVTSHWSQSTID